MVCQQEGVEVLFEVLMRLVIEFFDGGFFAGGVHALDLAIGPGLRGGGQPVCHGMFIADPCKDVCEGLCIPFPVREWDAVIGEPGVDVVGHGSDEVAQELGRHRLDGFGVQLSIRELQRAVDGDTHRELGFCGTYCGNIEVEVVERLGLARFLLRLVAFRVRQAADAMPLKAMVQRRSCQVRPRGLQGRQAAIQ